MHTAHYRALENNIGFFAGIEIIEWNRTNSSDTMQYAHCTYLADAIPYMLCCHFKGFKSGFGNRFCLLLSPPLFCRLFNNLSVHIFLCIFVFVFDCYCRMWHCLFARMFMSFFSLLLLLFFCCEKQSFFSPVLTVIFIRFVLKCSCSVSSVHLFNGVHGRYICLWCAFRIKTVHGYKMLCIIRCFCGLFE